MREDWPLLGRAGEIAAAMAGWERREVSGVLLTGGPGVGKTRLAQAVLRRLADAGCRTEWLAARTLAPIPFGAVAALLPEPARPSDGFAVLRAVTAELRARGGRRHVVIGVDDIEALDSGSAAVVTHIAESGLAFVVATSSVGSTPARAGMRVVELHGLPDEVIDELISYALGGEVDAVSRAVLRQAAGGNPYLLMVLLTELRRNRKLRRRHGVWHRVSDGLTIDPFDADLSARLVAKYVTTDEGLRGVAEIVACGEPVPLDLLERMVDGELVTRAENQGVITICRDGARVQAKLGRQISADVLLPALPVTAIRRASAGLSRASAGVPLSRRGDALRLAIWQLRSGLAPNARLLRVAGRRALGQGDLALAQTLAEAACTADPVPASIRLLAEVFVGRGQGRPALSVLGRLRGSSVTSHRLLLAAAVYLDRSVPERVERARRLLTGAKRPGSLVELARAWMALYEGRFDEVRGLVRAFASKGATGIVARAAPAVEAVAGAMLGRFDEAVGEAHRDDLADCVVAYLRGELRRAEEIAERGYRRSAAERSPVRAGAWAGLGGLVLAERGALGPAKRRLREAIVLLENDDPLQLLPCCLAALASSCALTGDAAGSERWQVAAARSGQSAPGLFVPWLELRHGWRLVGAGRLAAAIDAVRRAAELARAGGQLCVEAMARYDLARLGGPEPDPGRLWDLAETTGSEIVGAFARAAFGLATDDRTALVRAGDSFEKHGHELRAAEVFYAAARGFQRSGQDARAQLLRERANRLRLACEGVDTPLLSDLSSPVLTRREREVLLLARTHSSRAIAAELGLSVNTVNNYLGRAYAKLGISGRRDLGRLLQPD